MPYPMVSSKNLRKEGCVFWENWTIRNQEKIVNLLYKFQNKEYLYGDSFVSRPYSAYKSHKHAEKIFPLLKELWNNKNILIVEGEGTRLGVGNDLFENTQSIRRILAPSTNAFDLYSNIYQTVLSYWKDELVVLALGPTATVLASDLTKNEIQALDLGHIDIQYEWFKRGKSFEAVPGKYTSEVLDGRIIDKCLDEKYLSEIIAVIK